ncbi:MAG: conjugative transposon protein TraM [Rikenellaceae bacterium]
MLTKIAVISTLVSIFIISMYFNFREKEERPKEENATALNTTTPDPATPEIKAGRLQYTPRERAEEPLDINLTTKRPEVVEEVVEEQITAPQANTAYKDANKTAANFYSRPKVDHEKIRMQAQIEELKAQVREQSPPPVDNTIDDQLAIIERSYELAAKYSAKPEPQVEQYKKGKAQINPMSQVSGGVVSSLTPTSDATFSTAVGGAKFNDKNTIAACIETTQTIVNSGAVKFRLLEPMMVGRYELPQGTTITGQSRVSGERLNITISRIEHRGRIIPVELQIIDTDGVAGIFIPNSAEVSAIKQIVAGMGSDAESSLSISTQSAGAELLTDLGKSAISGVADYVGEKIKEVKVHLKAGYKVMLYQAKE